MSISEIVERFLRELSVDDRRRLRPASFYVAEARLAAERNQTVTPEGFARQGVDDFLGRAVFKDLFDPFSPLSSEWVLAEATRIARRVLTRADRQFHPRYGSAIAD